MSPQELKKTLTNLTCSCGTDILKAYRDGTVKLRSKIILFKSCGAVAVCRGCGKEHDVPIALLQKSSPVSTPIRHFILDKHKRSDQ